MKSKKYINFTTKNSTLINFLGNLEKYSLVDGQLGFSSYRQAFETIVEYLFKKKLLIIKYEEKEQ